MRAGDALNEPIQTTLGGKMVRRASRINGQISVSVDLASVNNGLQHMALALLLVHLASRPYVASPVNPFTVYERLH
jgi:hypothetical protein